MTTDLPPKPATSVIRIENGAAPFIQGYKCSACGAVFAEPTMCCRRCASRTAPEPFRAAQRGRVHTWSVVGRSYPGVAVPFVSVIVDLDDGLTLKGTLKEIAPDAVRAGMPVALVFDDAGGAKSAEGAAYVGYHFVPAEGGA